MPLKRKKNLEHPAWQPDFRDMEALPDTKAIRTDFVFNAFAVVLVLACAGYLLITQYTLSSLSSSLEDLEAQISENVGANRRNLQLSAQFKQLMPELQELSTFHEQPVALSEVLLLAASMQSEEIVLSSLRYNPFMDMSVKKGRLKYQLNIVGTVRGRDDQPASQLITEYRDALCRQPGVEAWVEEATMPRFRRNERLGLFDFAIQVLLDPAPKKKPT